MLKRLFLVLSSLFVFELSFAFPPQGTGAVWKEFLTINVTKTEKVKVWVDDDPKRVLGETYQDHLSIYGNLRPAFYIEIIDALRPSNGGLYPVKDWNFSFFKLDPLSGITFNLELVFEKTNADILTLNLEVSQSLLSNVNFHIFTNGAKVPLSVLTPVYSVALDSNGYLRGLLGANTALSAPPHVQLMGSRFRSTPGKLGTTIKPAFEAMTATFAIQDLFLRERRREVDRVPFDSLKNPPRGVQISEAAMKKMIAAREEFLQSLIPYSPYQNIQPKEALRVIREAYMDGKTGAQLGILLSLEVKPEFRHHFKNLGSPPRTYLLRGDELEEVPGNSRSCSSGLDRLLG